MTPKALMRKRLRCAERSGVQRARSRGLRCAALTEQPSAGGVRAAVGGSRDLQNRKCVKVCATLFQNMWLYCPFPMAKGLRCGPLIFSGGGGGAGAIEGRGGGGGLEKRALISHHEIWAPKNIGC